MSDLGDSQTEIQHRKSEITRCSICITFSKIKEQSIYQKNNTPMKKQLFTALFFVFTTIVFGQNYAENVRVVCFCDIHSRMQFIGDSRGNSPYIIAPSCSKHKPPLAVVAANTGNNSTTFKGFSFHFFKKRKKSKELLTDSHIIRPLSN